MDARGPNLAAAVWNRLYYILAFFLTAAPTFGRTLSAPATRRSAPCTLPTTLPTRRRGFP